MKNSVFLARWLPAIGLPALILLLPAFVPAATYYVDQNHSQASDTNSGTQSQPWLTIQHAADSVAPGDTVLVLPGSYTRTLITRSGEAGRKITFQGASAPDLSLMNPNAVFDPSNPVPVLGNAANNAVTQGFEVRSSYIRLEHFEVTAITGRGGIQLNGATDSEVIGNFIHDLNPTLYNHSGVRGNGHDTANILVQGNTLYHVQGTGISLTGQGWIVENNEVMHGIDVRSDTGEDTGGDVDAMRFFGMNHIIRNNYLHDYLNTECAGSPHMDAFQTFSVNPDTQFASYILVEGNTCKNFGQMFMCEDQSEQNGGINAVHHITFRNNIFQGSRAVSIVISDFSDHFTFVNNVVAQAYYTGLGISDHGHHATVLNNIFYYNGYSTYASCNSCNGGSQLTDPTCQTGSLWDFNLHYPDFTWPYKVPTIDQNSLFGQDPRFVDPDQGDFRLRSDSPAIDAGIKLSEFNYDKDGHYRPHGLGWDIGPYEYNSAYTPPPKNIGQVPVMVVPNPGRDYIRFHFSPQTPVAVTIFIYNIAGEQAAWVTGTVDPNWRTIGWDCADLAPGVYIYQVVQNGEKGARGKLALQ